MAADTAGVAEALADIIEGRRRRQHRKLRRKRLQDAVDKIFQTHLGLRLNLALVYTSAQEKREKKPVNRSRVHAHPRLRTSTRSQVLVLSHTLDPCKCFILALVASSLDLQQH